MSLQIEITRPRDLSAEQQLQWTARQYETPDLHSPFYAYGYTRCIAEHREDAYVGVIHDDGIILGFFPFHRRPGKIGVPIGGPINDFHGIILSHDSDIRPAYLLRGCGLDAYDFNHGLQSQTLFHRAAHTFVSSPALDLSSGYEGYRKTITDSGSSELKNTERKLRKLEHEMGGVRFIPDDKDPRTWNRFIEWKNDAYARMDVTSVLDVKWVRDALEHIRDIKTAEFSGVLSSLYVDDRLAAVHFGMRSRDVLHWWFPTYGPEFDAYSPGLILLVKLAQWGSENGVTQLDLGRGNERYKKAFSNMSIGLCEGSLEIGASIPGLLRQVGKTCHMAAKTTGSPRIVDFQRRWFNRALKAGKLYD